MAYEDLNKAGSRDKFLGIIEKVAQAKTYSAPAVMANEGVEMNGRSFTVTKSDTSALKDYKRNANNEFDYAKTEEMVYTLDQEKYWGRFVDKLDERDSDGQVNIDYIVARQAAEIVSPYLDQLRFDALIGNVADNISNASGDAYSQILDVSEKLDELAVESKIMFVTPAFYKKIKTLIVKLPQGDGDKQVLSRGYVGELDDFKIYKVPSKYLKNVDAIACEPGVIVSPLQIDETKYNNNVPGRFGELVEQLLYTGAFVFDFDAKKIFSIAVGKPEAKASAKGKVVDKSKKNE